ncbi:hypothetical protein H0H93_005195, partial [Arthromyces matolae]
MARSRVQLISPIPWSITRHTTSMTVLPSVTMWTDVVRFKPFPHPQPFKDPSDPPHLVVFVNLYYEFNNPLLDWVFSERSNL